MGIQIIKKKKKQSLAFLLNLKRRAEWQEYFDITCAVACTAWAAAMVIAPAPDPEDNEPRLYDANGWEEFVLYALFEEDDELLFRHPWWIEHIYEIQNETKFLCILRRVIWQPVKE